MKTLIKNTRTRRTLSLGLAGLGGVLLFLAPEGVMFGWILLALGIGLELVGITLGHQEQP